MIVFRRWATVNTVDPLRLVSIRFWMVYSVTTSMLDVASSRITTLDFLRIALHIQINYFSPELRLQPFSWIFILSPSSAIKLSSLAARRIFQIWSSVALFSGSRLYLSVPLNMVGSYGITVILLRRSFKFISAMFMPSTWIVPSQSSMILLRQRQMVLFPAPVLPTIPIL